MNSQQGYLDFIFDFDGTLADTAKLTMAALRAIAPGLGLSLPGDEHLRATIGFGGLDFYNALYPGADEQTRQALRDKLEAEEQRLHSSLKGQLLFPGCREMLFALRGAGARLYIASTGGPGHVHPLLAQEGIAPLFQDVYCGERDKTGMLKAIIGGAGGPCVMVGDMSKDHRAAHANGISCIGACYGYCVPRPNTFDYYVYKPQDLFAFLPAPKRELLRH